MTAVGPYLAAAALLVIAGVAKALRPGDTARALVQLRPGLRLAPTAAVVRSGALAEAVLGAAALAEPRRPLALAVGASYLAFACFVAVARARGGVLATCGCFGTSDTPPTRVHVLVDLAFAGAALAVALSPPAGSTLSVLAHQPLAGVPLVAGALLLTYLAVGAMAHLGRLQEARALLGGRAGVEEGARR